MSPLMNLHRGDAHPAARLSYIGYLLQFARLDMLELFTLEEHRLYHKLLQFFNDRDKEWTPRAEHFADTFLCMATGIRSVNTLKKARAGLELRGLIAFEGAAHGRGKMGSYRLLMVADGAPKMPVEKLSIKLSLDDTIIDSFTADSAGKLSEKLSGKLSGHDTNIENTIEVDCSNGGAARLQKKIEAHRFSLPDDDGAADGSAGADEGTGAAADVRTLIPQPLQPGEYIPGGFVDARLPDTDPRKWEARPGPPEVAAQVVDAYLSTLPDKVQHVGKGQLFIDYYEGKGWCTGKEGLTPIRNWRAVCRQFSFIDYQAKRTAEAVATGGSQIEKRASAAERARAKLHSGNNE
jgi:hypothetical protein